MSNSLTRDQLRSARKRPVRAKTFSSARTAKVRLMMLGAEIESLDYDRPRTRGDCQNAERPCPWVSCKWHLYVDITPKGNLKVNFPDIEPERMLESCALDVADIGGLPLEVVGALMNVTRERVRQLEVKAMAKLEPHLGETAREEFGGEPGRDRALDVVAIDAEHAMQFGQEDTAA